MSVRRLAEEAVQPAAFKFNRANASWAKKKLKDYPKGREASGVIPLLMRVQEQEGWVTKPAIEHIAEMLNMPLIRVLEVATFYTQFQLAPVGKKAHIQVCGTTPCMLRGAGELIAVCKKRIGPKPFEMTQDGALSWEEVECQGACVNAPMVMVFKDTYEDLTPERLEEIIDAFDAGKGDTITPGPQIDRVYSAPIGGLTSLIGGAAKAKKPRAAAKKAASAKAASKKTSTKKAATAKPTAKKAIAKKTASVTKAASKKATAKKAVATTKVVSKKAVAKKADTKKPAASAKPAKLVSLKDANRPAKIRKPAKLDDLKMISGVGPKIEGILHELGIYKFEQISKWKKAERQWVDGYLSFKGRIDREDWVKQAKALAKGGAEEYIRVFGKKPR